MDNSVFLTIPKEEYILESSSFFAIRDHFPVSPGHTLIISKAVKKDFFELNAEEHCELTKVILLAKENILRDYTPDGFNIGMNCGKSAGQTVFHFHCHIIPRYEGDMEDPRGGIRHCVKGKGHY
jgi:diadenosine tetraphosphate (Ap4A) HIT family hydrolase